MFFPKHSNERIQHFYLIIHVMSQNLSVSESFTLAGGAMKFRGGECKHSDFARSRDKRFSVQARDSLDPM